MQAFSTCGERGLLCSFPAQASHCGGFSCCGFRSCDTWAQEARVLGSKAPAQGAGAPRLEGAGHQPLSGSRAQAQEARVLGPRARAHGVWPPELSCSAACGIFLHQGSNSCLALVGGFFATEMLGKPISYHKRIHVRC